jgi:transcriptional regulator with XRE-family HTH domain
MNKHLLPSEPKPVPADATNSRRRRPIEFLRQMGRRIRTRRLHLGRTIVATAKAAEISTGQFKLYESGQGHPPVATLHRIAIALGTTSSKLLGEKEHDFPVTDQVIDDMMKLYGHPTIGAVTRYMQDMAKQDRLTLQVIARALANRRKPVETAEATQ